MSFLVDTNICSAYLKGNPQVWNRFLQYSGRLHICAVIAAELFAWAKRRKASPKRLQGLQKLLVATHFLEVNLELAEKFGELRASELDRGLSTPQMDLLIAATALVHDLTLVTHNVQDFANVRGLGVVDWLAP